MTGTCTGQVVLTQTGQEKLIQEPSVHQPNVLIRLGRQEKALHQLEAKSAMKPGLAGEHKFDHSRC